MAHSAPGWHREDIKAALRKKYGGICELAESWGLHRCAVSKALADPRDSVPTELRIAKALGMPPQSLWPDRWSENGTPLPRSDRAKFNAGITVDHSQKRSAA